MLTPHQVKSAKAAMISAGWDYILSAIKSDKSSGEYGLLFTKGEERFWLNVETIDKLPFAE